MAARATNTAGRSRTVRIRDVAGVRWTVRRPAASDSRTIRTPSPAPPSPLKNTSSNPPCPGARPWAQGMNPAMLVASAPIPTVSRAGVATTHENRPPGVGCQCIQSCICRSCMPTSIRPMPPRFPGTAARKRRFARLGDVNIARGLENLRLEQDAIALYDALATIDKDPRRAAAFRRIATNERRHADIWAARLRELGATVPPAARPRARVRLIILAARVLGTKAVSDLVKSLEGDEVELYDAQ